MVGRQAARRARQATEGRGAESDSDAAASYRRGRRLWDEIHSVHYSRWRSHPAFRIWRSLYWLLVMLRLMLPIMWLFPSWLVCTEKYCILRMEAVKKTERGDDGMCTVWSIRYDNPGERAGPSAAAPEEAPAPASSEEGSEAGGAEGTPLAELLACSAPDLDGGASGKTRDLLHLLKHLEALNRC